MIVRRAVVLLTLLLAALTAVPSPAGASLMPNLTCPGRTPLVDVSYRFLNDQLLDAEGEVWALGSGYGQFRLYAGAGAFCAVSTVVGTFTTFGGPSPAGTGTVPAGLTGSVAGTNVLRFTGTFAPTLPTRGFVGTFNAGCDQFDCATPIRFGRKYVTVTGPPELLAYRFVHVSRCGTWIETSLGNFGDVTC